MLNSSYFVSPFGAFAYVRSLSSRIVLTQFGITTIFLNLFTLRVLDRREPLNLLRHGLILKPSCL